MAKCEHNSVTWYQDSIEPEHIPLTFNCNDCGATAYLIIDPRDRADSLEWDNDED
jgi:hypothetical protein